MRRALPCAVAIVIVGVAASLICWLRGTTRPSGCPPELLWVFQKEDRLAGHPATVREEERHYDGGRPIITTATTYTSRGEVLYRNVSSAVGSSVFTQTTTYSYDQRGWVLHSLTVPNHRETVKMSFLYEPAIRRIEVETWYIHPYPSTPPSPFVGYPTPRWTWLDRVKGYLPWSCRELESRDVIRLDRRNRYIEVAHSDGRHALGRNTFDYDGSGRVRRQTRHGHSYRRSWVYERDARGNVVEQKIVDDAGKLERDSGIMFSSYKYDAVGNWIERRSTVFWPRRTRHRWTLSSITTRGITYRR